MGKSIRVLGLYDKPMWESIANRLWALQYCPESDSFRYPPSPCVPTASRRSTNGGPSRDGRDSLLGGLPQDLLRRPPRPYNNVAVRLDDEDRADYVLPRMKLV